MIYECTDCSNCASFASGFRVFCLAEELEPNEVCNYYPVGHGDAGDCICFDMDWPTDFAWDDLEEAEKYSEEKYGEITYQGIKEWCIERLASAAKSRLEDGEG